ncbi:MAG: DUF4280 domain-containing protein, partial [Pyrinomonadaceae bacterium]
MSDENKKYVPEGAFLVCDKGTIPTQLICDPQPIHIYSVRYADENDKKPIANIPSFGVCKTLGGPCGPPAPVLWTKIKEDVTLHGFKPLLEDSEAICAAGAVGKIKIFFDKYEAELAAENNSESDFVKEPISSSILGFLGGGAIIGMFAPELRDGIGRGLKKGAEGTWNFIKSLGSLQGWQDFGTGLLNLGVIGAAYTTPAGPIAGDTILGAVDGIFGSNFRQTKDNMATGISDAASHSWENVKRGNWGEVGEDIGQVEWIIAEAVVGSKGAGAVAQGVRRSAQTASRLGRAVVGAERLAQISARSAQVLNRIKNSVSGVVRIGRKVDNVAQSQGAFSRAVSAIEELAENFKNKTVAADGDKTLSGWKGKQNPR